MTNPPSPLIPCHLPTCLWFTTHEKYTGVAFTSSLIAIHHLPFTLHCQSAPMADKRLDKLTSSSAGYVKQSSDRAKYTPCVPPAHLSLLPRVAPDFVPRNLTTCVQELGPRFTLKMRWLQEGTFDTQFGEYEWIHKRKEMDSTRRTFHL